jgi:ABC-type dipeptide/oligopeptide/nickel transport system permease subunit
MILAKVLLGELSHERAWHMLLPAALCVSLFAMDFYLVSRGLHRVASPTIREGQAVA